MADNAGTSSPIEVSENDVSALMRLDGCKAIVTGAGRGLGRSCSLVLAAAGAHVVAVARTAQDLDTLAAEKVDGGGRIEGATCDVCDDGAVKDLMREHSDIGILVNNAGTNRPQPVLEVEADSLDAMLALNVRAAFVVAREAARSMVAGTGGSIINMSSQMGHVGAANRSVYCTTKHAVEGMTKAMAVELAPHGIRVNAVAPTFVETPLTRPYFENAAFHDEVLKNIPMNRTGRPVEVSAAVLFLASPAASLITGTSLRVDGGWTAR